MKGLLDFEHDFQDKQDGQNGENPVHPYNLFNGESGYGTVEYCGAISFTTVPGGVGDVCVKVNGTLSVKKVGVDLSGSVNIGNIAVMLPDILNDDIWDDFELNEINGGFGNSVSPGTGADYNCYGFYDDFYLNQIKGGFVSRGDCYAF